MNWLKDTTMSYRIGYIEAETGVRDGYKIEAAARDVSEYNRGFNDRLKELAESEGEE